MEIAEVNGAQAQEPWHNLVLDTCDPFLTFLSGFIQNFTHWGNVALFSTDE